MPLVQIKGIEGCLSLAQKQELIRRITDVVVSVEGEGVPPSPGSLSKTWPRAPGAWVGNP